MRILVLRAPSQHNVLSRMAEHLYGAFGETAADASLLVIEMANWGQALVERIQQFGPDYVVSFASFTADLQTVEGHSVYERLGCGFIGWDCDHPAYQFKRFAAPVPRRVQICASQSHVDYARLIAARGDHALMLPGVAEVAPDPLPIEERPMAALIAMSWMGEPQTWWAAMKGQPVYDLVEGVVGRMLADEAVDLLAAYRATVRDKGFDIAFNEDVSNLLANCGLFVRQYDRIRLAHTLAELDRPVVLCGTGWEERLGGAKNLTFADSLDFDRCPEVYGQAKVVLNLNGANGASERAVTAMAAGAVVVSDYSPLLEAEFGAAGAIRFYQRRDPAASVGQVLSDVLDSGGAQAIADAGRARVAQAHLWSHKAHALVALAEGRTAAAA